MRDLLGILVMMDRGTVTMVSVHVVRDGVHVKRESLRLKGGEGENDECRKAPAHLPSLWEPAGRVNALSGGDYAGGPSMPRICPPNASASARSCVT